MKQHNACPDQGVGPSTTLAWSGWMQPDIAMEADTARLETSRTDTVKELPGFSVQNCPYGSFLFLFFDGGTAGSGGIIYDIVRKGCPRRTSGKCCVHLYAFVSYRRLSAHFQFSLSTVTLVYLSQWSGPLVS
jgi:hypothetical protein